MCSNTAYRLLAAVLQLLLSVRALPAASCPVLAPKRKRQELSLLRRRRRRIQPRRIFRVPLFLTFVLLCVLLLPNSCLFALGLHGRGLGIRDVTELLDSSPGILLRHEHAIVLIDRDSHRVIEPAQAASRPAHITEQVAIAIEDL